MTRPIKICIVSSCGGHLTEVRALRAAYENLNHFYVLNDQAILPADMIGKTYFITHSERDWRTALNFWEAFRILYRERPTVVLSTGAGPVVPFAILCRLAFDTRVVFIETLTRIERPSMTARLMYWLADDFFYQWRQLEKFFPRGRFGGQLI